jgi:uncharacterized protein YqeY
MTLKEKINSDYIEAFKAKNTIKKNLLSVIKSEIQTLEKNSQIQNLTDEDVIKILNKTSKSLKETLSLISDSDKISSVKAELNLVESYLPKQLSVEEIQVKIDALVASGVNNIGQIMREFSSLPADKKIVSELAKKSLV